MASTQSGNDVAVSGKKTMTADYGQRAALALDRLLPSRHRNKTVEAMFECCPRQARNLRAGLYWTIDRLNRGSAVLGAAFDAIVAGLDPDHAHSIEMLEIAERVARLEDLVDDALVGGLAPVIPPSPGTAAAGLGREMPPTERAKAAAGSGRTSSSSC